MGRRGVSVDRARRARERTRLGKEMSCQDETAGAAEGQIREQETGACGPEEMRPRAVEPSCLKHPQAGHLGRGAAK